jgi:hypothetical protein
MANGLAARKNYAKRKDSDKRRFLRKPGRAESRRRVRLRLTP